MLQTNALPVAMMCAADCAAYKEEQKKNEINNRFSIQIKNSNIFNILCF